MHYRQARINDVPDISGLSRDELGWTTSPKHLKEVVQRYPGVVALNSHGVCGFAYSNPLSSDVLRISNLLVSRDYRHQGVGQRLLGMLEKGAKQDGYKALLFPEDQRWFQDGSVRWIEDQGYRSIYNTDRSRIVLKEIA